LKINYFSAGNNETYIYILAKNSTKIAAIRAAFLTHHIITSHGENGSRPQGPLYPRNNNCNRFINMLLLIYNTPVSGASEISFIIKNHFVV